MTDKSQRPMATPEIVLRAEAAAKGLRRYFSGKPCPEGHTAERYTLNGGCVECQHKANRADRDRVRSQLR